MDIQSLQGHGIAMLLQKQLNLCLDHEGVIHCQGHIEHSSVPVSSKSQVLMPKHHHFTDLLIRQKHNQVFHDEICETLHLIRETHWIRCDR